MLRAVSRTVKYGIAKNPFLSRKPILASSGWIQNFHATPVAARKQDLPKLPVPKLNDTLEKFLRSVIPLLGNCELQSSTRVIKEFGENNGCGETLQEFLVERAKCQENWLEEWWLKTAYLGFRNPVTFYSSPGLVFPLVKFCNRKEQLEFATKMIISAMKYKALVDNDKIPLEKMGKDPLDMGQYKKFFGTNRRPAENVDKLEFNPCSKHIVVACNNHFFKLYPVNDSNEILSECQILEMLNEIDSLAATPGPAVGILSSDHRDTWACNYKLLTKECVNKTSVEEIETALILLCLDGQMPEMQCSNRLTVAGHETIHGGGSKAFGGNRWFDKTLQLIVGSDGINGFTYEHSPSEGQPIAVMTDFLIDHMKDPLLKYKSCAKPIEHLKFIITPEIQSAIDEAGKTLDCLVDDIDLECHIFTNFGKNAIKQHKLSPDSFIQMAMQLAYYRLHCEPAAHYESAQTRKYIGGRTETIRSCSVESVKFAKAMLDPKACDPDKRNFLIAAVNAHKKFTTDAVTGYGIDRHLLGLKLAAKHKRMEIPEIFSDRAFTRSTHFDITSSQVATKCPGFMCYGPTEQDGYGICYNPRDENIYYGVSSHKSCDKTKSIKMKEAFEQSLCDMHTVLSKTPQAKL